MNPTLVFRLALTPDEKLILLALLADAPRAAGTDRLATRTGMGVARVIGACRLLVGAGYVVRVGRENQPLPGWRLL